MLACQSLQHPTSTPQPVSYCPSSLLPAWSKKNSLHLPSKHENCYGKHTSSCDQNAFLRSTVPHPAFYQPECLTLMEGSAQQQQLWMCVCVCVCVCAGVFVRVRLWLGSGVSSSAPLLHPPTEPRAAVFPLRAGPLSEERQDGSAA